MGLANGIKNDRHCVSGRVLHITLVGRQLALHALKNDAVQVPQPGTHVGPGQHSLPNPKAVGVKQPLNGVGKYLCRIRVEDPKLAVLQYLRQLFLLAHTPGGGEILPSRPRLRQSAPFTDGQTDFCMTLFSISFFFIIGVPFRYFWKCRSRTFRDAGSALLVVLYRHF